uniref:Phosphate uptake regulator PhoU n=1 Tax=Thermofilum pendens TaxID=2269 RepID=A0A7C3WUW9_THEPE
MASARKLIKLGKSSLAVTLPRKWVGELGLREGDLVLVEEHDDYLIISAADRRREEERRAHIEAGRGEEDSLARMIIALYQAGYDVIRISTPEGRASALRGTLRRTLSRLIGLEIVEEGADYVVLQMVTDAAAMSAERVLNRMEILVLNSLKDLDLYSRSGDTSILSDIVERDEEIDKFYFLLSRQVSQALKNPAYLRHIGVEDRPLLLPIFNYGKTLERVGDVLVGLARTAAYVRIETEAVEAARKAVEAGIKAFHLGDETSKRKIVSLYTEYFSSERYSLVEHLIGNIISLSLDMLESRVELEVLLSGQQRNSR